MVSAAKGGHPLSEIEGHAAHRNGASDRELGQRGGDREQILYAMAFLASDLAGRCEGGSDPVPVCGMDVGQKLFGADRVGPWQAS